MLTPQKIGILLALVSAMGSAIFMIPWKLAASSGASAADMVFLLCLAGAVFNTFTLFFQHRLKIVHLRFNPIEVRLSFLFAIFTLAGNWASARSIYYLAPAVVTTMMRVEILFVAFIASYFLSEKVTKRFWFGFAMVALGFYLMQPSVSFENDWWLGLLLAVSAALIFACKAVVTRAYIHSIDPSLVNTARLWLSVLLWFPLQRHLPDWDIWDENFLILVCIAAFLGPFLGRIAFMNSSRFIEARISALVVGISPVLAVFFSWLFINSIPSASELTGGSLVMLGTIVSLLEPQLLLSKWHTK